MVELEIAQIDAVDQDAARLGSQNRSNRFASVVLPAPEGPTIATVAPAGMSRVTALRAGRCAPG